MIAVTRITLTAAFACACAAHAQGPVPREQVFAWGDKQWGQCEILPRGREFVQVAAGACHTIALRADGTIFGTRIYFYYGTADYGQSSPPSGKFTWVTAGYRTSAAVKADGSIVGFGADAQLWSRPADGFIEASGSLGGSHFIARRANGSISSTVVPPYRPANTRDDLGAYVFISAGYTDTYAIRADGALWTHSNGILSGYTGLRQACGGSEHQTYLRTNGTVFSEGSNQYGQLNSPQGTFVQIAAGARYSVALDEAGTLRAWGYTSPYCCAPSENLPNYMQNARWSMISAGEGHMVGIPLACYSDLDMDRKVDTADLSLMLLDFGACDSCDADLDQSGQVDTADLSLLLLDFGSCP